MPDTYTSQFSGEEIDSALRAAQIISGASTPAELRKKLEIRGDTIPVSATDPTPVSEALSASGGGINPNLLDNWFFGRPVNQRNGYIVPAGVDYYTFAWEKVGQTDKNYQVLLRRNAENNYDCEIEINGTRYVVGGANSVPGYCDGYSYTIDRWKTEGNIVVTLESDGISLENVGVEAGQFKQELPPDFSPEGTLLCISAIVKSASGDARLLLSQSDSPWGHTVDFIPLQTGFFSGSGNLMGGNHKFSIYLGAGAKIKLAAAKLELGSQQTLAHKEDGVWVLNEIPDYGEQLARCQRFCRVIGGTLNQPFCIAVRRETTALEGFIPIDNPFRTAPSISVNGYFSVIPDFYGVKFTSGDTLSPQGVTLFFERQDGGTFDKDAYLIYAGADTRITLSADL